MNMEKTTEFVINLKEQTTDVAEYQWTLDDGFFGGIEAAVVQQGHVDARLAVHKTSGAFELEFRFAGTVIVPCDRCLEDMSQPIDAEGELRVKLGDDYDDDGELVTIPYSDGKLDVAWYLYEFIALNIPLRHVHDDGQCGGDLDEILDNN